MDLGIRGRTAIVCAASKGLGRGCAEALAAAGVNLVVNARTPGPLEATAQALRAHGVTVTTVAADVTTYLRGDAKIVSGGGGGVDPNVPFLVDFRSGSGSVAYTSYHIHQNEAVNDFFAFIAMNFK